MPWLFHIQLTIVAQYGVVSENANLRDSRSYKIGGGEQSYANLPMRAFFRQIRRSSKQFPCSNPKPQTHPKTEV